MQSKVHFGKNAKSFILKAINRLLIVMKKALLITTVVIIAVAVISIASILYPGQQVSVKYNGTLTVNSDSGYPGDLEVTIFYNQHSV